MQRIHIWVSGVVVGVGFRYFTVRKAREFGVSGWVRNTPDGKVEVVAEGEKWQLKELTGSLKVGPSSSSVSGIDAEEEKYQNEFDGFEVRF
ncbi:MAG: acylphosphatase [candidate division WOR-3 bacterium]